jgi:hypothetical protein
MSSWLAGLAEAVATWLAGPTGAARMNVGNDANATADALLAEWRTMRLPADRDVGGERRVVEGIDLVLLATEVDAFASVTPLLREERRAGLLRRLDLVVPPLSGEARGYFAMAREVVRRLGRADGRPDSEDASPR